MTDRELDAKLAEALGIKVVATDWACGSDPECGHYYACVDRDNPRGYDWYNERGPVYFYPNTETAVPVPHYSTDIRATFDLVEEMRRREWSLRIGTNACAKGQNAAAFSQGFRGLGADILTGRSCYDDGAWSVADTIPRAIAKAALAALEVK